MCSQSLRASAAWPFMVTLFFWSRAGRWRILLVGYTLAMAFTLVYTADHFVFDILLGWTYATIVFVVARAIWRRRGSWYATSQPSMRRPLRKSS